MKWRHPALTSPCISCCFWPLCLTRCNLQLILPPATPYPQRDAAGDQSRCMGLRGFSWGQVSIGHVSAELSPGRGHPGGGTVKLLRFATSRCSFFPSHLLPRNLFSCLEDGDTALQKLGWEKKKKKEKAANKLNLRKTDDGFMIAGVFLSLPHIRTSTDWLAEIEMFTLHKVMLYNFLPRATTGTVLF